MYLFCRYDNGCVAVGCFRRHSLSQLGAQWENAGLIIMGHGFIHMLLVQSLLSFVLFNSHFRK